MFCPELPVRQGAVARTDAHEWDQSDDYIAPEKELVEMIRQDPLPVAKLRRFDVYKSLLYKGVKLTEAEITQWSTEVRHGE